MDPNTYMAWMNPNAYIPGGTTAGYTTTNPGASFNWFDPNAWTGMMTPKSQEPAETPAQQ